MNPIIHEAVRKGLLARVTQSLEEHIAESNKLMDEGWKPRDPEDTPVDVVLAVLKLEVVAEGIAVAVWKIPPKAYGLERWTSRSTEVWADVIQTAVAESDGDGYFIISEIFMADCSNEAEHARYVEQKEKGLRIHEMEGVSKAERAMLRLQLGPINLVLWAAKDEDGRWGAITVPQDGTKESKAHISLRFDPIYNPPPGTLEN